MKDALEVIILLILLYALYKWRNPKPYALYFYPDKTHMNKFLETSPLKTKKDCYGVLKLYVKYNTENGKQWDYECGKNCRPGDPYGQGVRYTCESSFK